MAFVKEYFRHDIGSLMDDKLNALVLEYGADGYAVYYLSIEYLYRDRGEPISPRLIKRIASDLKLTPDRVTEILDYAASEDCGQMLEKSEEGFLSHRVNKSLQEREEEHRKKSEGGKKGMAKRWPKKVQE